MNGDCGARIRAVSQWLRLVQPRPAILILIVAMSVACEVVYWVVGRSVQLPNPRKFFLPGDFLLAMGSFWMGVHRVIVKHPALDRQHYLWLVQMPWAVASRCRRGRSTW